jgi:uncharacterized cupredoxin-like copper-binding protein
MVRRGFLVLVAVLLIPVTASVMTVEAADTNQDGTSLGDSTFERENNRFEGEEVAFTLDEGLPGIRNVTHRSTGTVLFDEVRLEDGENLDWSVDFDSFSLSGGPGDAVLTGYDDEPAPIRTLVIEDADDENTWLPSQNTWHLSVGPEVSVTRGEGDAQDALMTSWDEYYVLEFGRNRTTYLVGSSPTYDSSSRTFSVPESSLVYQADRVTIEADDGGHCREGEKCLRFRGFAGGLDAGDRVRLHVENEGNSSHSFWIARNEDVDWDPLNASTDDAIAGVAEIAPGQEVSLNFTIPNGTRTLFAWCNLSGHAREGEQLRWPLEAASGGGAGDDGRLSPFLGVFGVLVVLGMVALSRSSPR